MLLFLVVATWYWYGPREDLAVAANISKYTLNKDIEIKKAKDLELDNKDVDFTLINKTDKKQNYEIIISNDYKELRKENCKLVSNNYLKYQLKVDDTYQEIRNLGIDGIVYRGVIDPNQSKDFSIKIAMDKKARNYSDECFFPLLNASTYDKI